MSDAVKNEAVPFELMCVQLFADDHFKGRSGDGTGYDFVPAEHARDWMDKSPRRFAYRCLPLTVANQLGYWITNPIGFTADWEGGEAKVKFTFDSKPERWSRLINDQFGGGVLTWNNPFFIRTKPAGSRILVMPPANRFKPNVQCLTAWVETDWLVATFTMNWRIVRPGRVRFEVGEPIAQLLPLTNNCLEALEGARVRLRSAAEERELHNEYLEWSRSRSDFLEMQRREKAWDEWQRDYFRGREAKSPAVATMGHNIKVKHPAIEGAARLALGTAPPESALPGYSDAIPAAAPVASGESILTWAKTKAFAATVKAADGFLELGTRAAWSVVWNGGKSFTVTSAEDTRGRCDPAPPANSPAPDANADGTLLVRTGVHVHWPADNDLSVLPARGFGGSVCRVAHELVPHAAGGHTIDLRVEFFQRDVPVVLAPGVPLARIGLGLRSAIAMNPAVV